jgi:uracil-DNA glycosylase
MSGKLPADWSRLLADELSQPYFAELQAFVDAERLRYAVYPPADEVFTAFALTPWKQVRVVLLGQDPYHQPGQAHGLCFSVRPGVAPPPSLVNIFRELRDDIGCPQSRDGDLGPWARQGVLLLNTTLTVRADQAHSHRGHGWERFTDAVIEKLNAQPIPQVFVLWGRPAQEKAKLIDAARHAVLMAAHPSPLSAHRGFLGSRPFSAINQALQQFGHREIDWCLPTRTANR